MGTSAPQEVPEIDLRTLERETAFSVEKRTWDLKERWLSRWILRNRVEGEEEGTILWLLRVKTRS